MANHCNLETFQGDYRAALTLQTENLEIQRTLGAREGILLAHNSPALISVHLGGYDVAYGHLREAAGLCRESGRDVHKTEVLETFAALAEARQQPERATQFYGTAESARKRLNWPSIRRNRRHALLFILDFGRPWENQSS